MSQPTGPLFQVWNEAKQRAEDLPLEQAKEQIFNPTSKVGLIPGQKYYFKDQSGAVFETEAPDDVFANLQSGLTPISQEQASREQFAESGVGQAASFGAGALRGLSFGLSDVALTQGAKLIGGQEAQKSTQDYLKTFEDVNPFLTAAGNVAGVAGGLFIPGGAVAAVGKLGRAAAETKAVSGLVKAATTSSPVLNRALETGLKLGVGSSVEGMFFGAGRALTETALGRTDSLAESLLANASHDAVIGGALGGALGVIGGGASGAFASLFGKKGVAQAVSNLDAVAAKAERVLQEPIPISTRPDDLGVLQAGKRSQSVGEPIAVSGAVDETGVVGVPRRMQTSVGEPIPVSQSVGEPIPVSQGVTGGASTEAAAATPQIQLPSNAQEFIAKVGKKFARVTGDVRNLTRDEIAAIESVFDNNALGRQYLTDPKKFKQELFSELKQVAAQTDDNAIALSTRIDELIDAAQFDPATSVRAIENIEDTLRQIGQDFAMNPSPYQKEVQRTVTEFEKYLEALAPRDLEGQFGRVTTGNTFKQLRQFKQAMFKNTTAGLKARKVLAGAAEAEVAAAYDKIYDSINATLKDESLFGGLGKALADVDQFHAERLGTLQKLKDAGVVKKVNRGYEISDKATGKLIADPETADLFETFLNSDYNMKKAAETLQNLSGTSLDLGAISPTAAQRVRAALELQPLFKNELTTGKAAIIGDVLAGAGSMFGVQGYAAARALGHSLENPGLIVQRLAQLYESADRLGSAVAGAKDLTGLLKEGLLGQAGGAVAATGAGASAGSQAKSVLQGALAQVEAKMTAEANLEAIKYLQMKDAERAQQNVQSSIQKAADGLTKKEPPKGVPQASLTRPLSLKRFDELKNNLMGAQDRTGAIRESMGLTMPQTGEALAVKANEAKAFLASKLPPVQMDTLGFNERPPSKVQLASFSRYAGAVEDPMSVLRDLSQGYVNKEGMETLRVLYPQMYAALQESMKARVTGKENLKNVAVIAQVLGVSRAAELGLTAQAVWSGANAEQVSRERGQAPSGLGGSSQGQKIRVDVASAQDPNRRGSYV